MPRWALWRIRLAAAVPDHASDTSAMCRLQLHRTPICFGHPPPGTAGRRPIEQGDRRTAAPRTPMISAARMTRVPFGTLTIWSVVDGGVHQVGLPPAVRITLTSVLIGLPES